MLVISGGGPEIVVVAVTAGVGVLTGIADMEVAWNIFTGYTFSVRVRSAVSVLLSLRNQVCCNDLETRARSYLSVFASYFTISQKVSVDAEVFAIMSPATNFGWSAAVVGAGVAAPDPD